MEFCISAINDKIDIDDVKDPEKRHKIELLTKTYFAGLYELIDEPVNIEFGGVINLKYKKEICCICTENCIGRSPVCTKCDCVNIYHKKCLETWFKQKKICPTCRKAFNSRSKGYEEVKIQNPFGTPKNSTNKKATGKGPPQNFKYVCDGLTHAKRSNFKKLSSALVHAKQKHHLQINQNRWGMWNCQYGGICDGTANFTEEQLFEHLCSFHDCKVIIAK